jgi:ubiquinone/menaquinone biosynthesis C-methylase UbiE
MPQGPDKPRSLEIGIPTEYGFELPRQQFALTEPDLDNAGSLLDVGCGNGANTVMFADLVGQIVGVDIEPQRVAEARRVAEEMGISNIEYMTYDGAELPFPDRCFDHVTSFDVLEHVEDEALTLREMRRVLAPTGKLSISVPNKWYLMDVHGFDLWPRQIPWNRMPLMSWLPTPLHERYAHARIYSRRRILRRISRSGFKVVSHRYTMPPFDRVKSKRTRRLLIGTWDVIERTPLRVLGLRHFIVAMPVYRRAWFSPGRNGQSPPTAVP